MTACISLHDYVFGDENSSAGIACITGDAGERVDRRLTRADFVDIVRSYLDCEHEDRESLEAMRAEIGDGEAQNALYADYQVRAETFSLYWSSADHQGGMPCGEYPSLEAALAGISEALEEIISQCMDDDQRAEMRAGYFIAFDEANGGERAYVPGSELTTRLSWPPVHVAA